MFIHTRLSAPKTFAKLGCRTRTFVTKRRKKRSAKLESDLRVVDMYFSAQTDSSGKESVHQTEKVAIMAITGYATSKSRSVASAQLLAKMLMSNTQEVRPAHVLTSLKTCRLL